MLDRSTISVISVVAMTALLGGSLGCGAAVQTHQASGATCGPHRTYAWASPAKPGAASLEPAAAQRLHQEIARQLAPRGIQAAAEGTAPDFYITAGVVETQGTPDVDFGYGSGPAMIGKTDYTSTSEALFLEFRDACSGGLFFTGSARDGVKELRSAGPEEAEGVRQILARYDAAAGG